jgi:hypothetical protein
MLRAELVETQQRCRQLEADFLSLDATARSDSGGTAEIRQAWQMVAAFKKRCVRLHGNRPHWDPACHLRVGTSKDGSGDVHGAAFTLCYCCMKVCGAQCRAEHCAQRAC